MATQRRLTDDELYTRLNKAKESHIPPDTLKAWFVQASEEAFERNREMADLGCENEDYVKHLSCMQRQLDAVDSALPAWKGTGRGRVETIEELIRERDGLADEIHEAGYHDAE